MVHVQMHWIHAQLYVLIPSYLDILIKIPVQWKYNLHIATVLFVSQYVLHLKVYKHSVGNKKGGIIICLKNVLY